MWNNKRTYNFWRPSTAILDAADDGNPDTEADAGWLPLINDPPYPDYTSGANGITGATMRALENFFRNDVWTFNATTNALEGGLPIAPRTYHRFSAMADDVVEARILLGIHFRFADTVARRQGTQSADRAFARVLRPWLTLAPLEPPAARGRGLTRGRSRFGDLRRASSARRRTTGSVPSSRFLIIRNRLPSATRRRRGPPIAEPKPAYLPASVE